MDSKLKTTKTAKNWTTYFWHFMAVTQTSPSQCFAFAQIQGLEILLYTYSSGIEQTNQIDLPLSTLLYFEKRDSGLVPGVQESLKTA